MNAYKFNEKDHAAYHWGNILFPFMNRTTLLVLIILSILSLILSSKSPAPAIWRTFENFILLEMLLQIAWERGWKLTVKDSKEKIKKQKRDDMILANDVEWCEIYNILLIDSSRSNVIFLLWWSLTNYETKEKKKIIKK